MIPKDLPKNGFYIYTLTNLVNGKVYVGKTNSPYNRCHAYIYAVKTRRNKYINDYLLNAFLKHGIKNFRMDLIDSSNSENELSQKELDWMIKLKTTDSNFGYNLRMDSSTKMIVHENTRVKISNRLKKEWSEGIRNNHSEKLKSSWKNDHLRRKTQSKIFSNIKRKYKYSLNDSPFLIDYETLVLIGLKNCFSNFHRQKSHIVIFKNIKIERKVIKNGSQT